MGFLVSYMWKDKHDNLKKEMEALILRNKELEKENEDLKRILHETP